MNCIFGSAISRANKQDHSAVTREPVHKSMQASLLSKICQRPFVRSSFHRNTFVSRPGLGRMTMPPEARSVQTEAAPAVASDLRTLEVR